MESKVHERTDAFGADENAIKNWSIGLGVVMAILGLATMILSSFATLFTVILLGTILAVRGGIDIITAFSAHRGDGFWLHLFGGILTLVVGALILTRPGATAAAVTLLIAASMLVMGLFRAISAGVIRFSGWGRELIGGIASLIVGAWIFSLWPGISVMLIGLLIGAEILVSGIILISLPYALTKAGGPSRQAFAR